MRTIRLDGTWRVREEAIGCEGEKGLARVRAARAGWMEARVPGEIHLDLMRAGRMEEPLESTNAARCRWPENRSWWYRRTFRVGNAFLAHERQELVLEGVDLYGQAFLNGVLVGCCENAFVPAVFDVRRHLKRGRNELVIRVTAGSERSPEQARPKPPRGDLYGNRSFAGRRWLRKPQFTYGWDWVDALPNVGLWRGARLEARSGAVLADLRLDTLFHDKAVYLHAVASVENLHPWAERPFVLELSIRPPDGRSPIRRRYCMDAPPGRVPLEDWIEVPRPQLWWPNGMGEQPLYRVTARVLAGKQECDRRQCSLGLRTVELDRSPLRQGSRFCVRVNGQDVFCKGGNWIPPDAILARAEPAKYETLVAEARGANMNMLRVWGGGVFEHPSFYDACDRAGILVWHDFLFACSTYPDDDPKFRDTVRAEAESAVRALRHHPCIALWSGNNENVWGFAEWWNKGKGVADKDLSLGGSLLYNQVLPEVCRALDPCRPYWPSSPAGGPTPNSEIAGDCHWWHPGTMNPDIERRIRHEIYDECRARFVSEYGVIGPCHEDSIRQYLKPGERKPGSRAWKIHTNTFEKATLPAALRLHYADPDNLTVAQYILYGQMFQATLYGRTVEALRFRKKDARDDCQGALIWMYSDCWGETGWTLVDYYLRRKASYYWFRRACAPVKAIVRRRGRALVVRVVNDTLRDVTATLESGWVRVDGGGRRLTRERVRIPANGMVEVERVPLPAKSEKDPREWVYAARLSGRDIEDAPSVWALAPHRALRLPRPRIEVRVQGRDIVLQSPAYCHGVHAEDHGRAMLSDNFFDLLPGVPKTIRRVDGKPARGLRFRAVV